MCQDDEKNRSLHPAPPPPNKLQQFDKKFSNRGLDFASQGNFFGRPMKCADFLVTYKLGFILFTIDRTVS